MTITRVIHWHFGAAALGAASIPIIGARAAVDDVPTANVKAPEYKIEQGASLHMIRPAKFIDPDEIVWKENTKKFTEKTGVDVKVDFVELGRPPPAARRDRQYRRRRRPVHRASAPIRTSMPTSWSSITDLAEYLGAQVRWLV